MPIWIFCALNFFFNIKLYLLVYSWNKSLLDILLADIFLPVQRVSFDFVCGLLCLLCLVAQLNLTLGDPVDCSPPGSSVHGDYPGKNTGVGCHALLQGIFPTQGSNPGVPHCRWTLYQLSHKGSPSIVNGNILNKIKESIQKTKDDLCHPNSTPNRSPDTF